MQRVAVCAALLATTTTALATPPRLFVVADHEPDESGKLVIVNAAGTNAGQIARIHRALDQREMLFRTNESLEATLEGRSQLQSDLDLIKQAYGSGNFANALKIIDTDEKELLDHGGSELATQLSALAGWRGLIYGADQKPDEALKQFRAAFRFNPAWTVDKKIPSPTVRGIITNAKREPDEQGSLRTSTDPSDAKVLVDGNVQKDAGEKVKLPIGLHLVQISFEGKKTYSEIVDILEGKSTKVEVTLSRENESDKAAKLVDETIAAAPGAARLDRARALGKLTGSNRLLVIEGGTEDHVNARVYDISAKKVSKSFSLDGNASAASIVGAIKSAFDDGDTVTGTKDGFDPGGGSDDEKHDKWYGKWWVWAAAAAVVGGVVIGVEASKGGDPTMLKGF
ncbi:MAG: PEGA domain-containing protein [Kofleriaceae bacterium]